MSAYEPIQMPAFQGFGIADLIMDIRKQKAAQDQARANYLLEQQKLASLDKQRGAENTIQQGQLAIQQQAAERQQMASVNEAKQAISAAVDAGRIDQAKQIAATYNIPFDERTIRGSAPQVPGAGDSLLAPSRERPNPTPEYGPQATPEIARNAALIRNEQASFEPGAPSDTQAVRAGQDERVRFAQAQAPTSYETPQVTPGTPDRQGYSIAGLGYDPEEVQRSRATQRQRNSDLVGGAFGGVDQKYQILASTLASAGVAPEKIAPIISAEMEKDNAREATDTNKQADRQLRREEDAKYRRSFAEAMQLAQVNAGGRVAAARASSESPAKIDASAARDRALAGRVLNDADKVANLKTIVSSNDALHSAMSNITSDNPLAHKDAQIQLARAIRGTVPTAAEEHMLYNNLGGILDKIPQGWALLQNGDLSGKQLQMVQDAVRNVQHETSVQADKAYQSYSQMAQDPALQNLAPTLNAGVRQRFARVGRDVPDVIKTAPGEQGTSVLGAARKAANDRNMARVNTLRGASDLNARARAALADPEATPAEKARAQQILNQ